MKALHLCVIPLLLPLLAPPARAEDRREREPTTLDDFHPFRPIASAEAWPDRKKKIRLRTRVAAGLWPLPAKTALEPVIHGTVERDGFTVSRVFFQSLPGHFVTGSLFLPTGPSRERALLNGKRPGILCPHGHWRNGRFYDAGEPRALQDVAIGAERFVTAARNPIHARCVQLARMGCVVFHYDMIGYADSIQFAEHRRGPRPRLHSLVEGKWGFVSPAATARLQTNFGLQTWNSMRALDFLYTLDEVDPERILVTGASGGATQTMMLAAIDDRVDASFPCVMASTAMQGGCTCENSHYLRIGQGNIDLAAAVAPKPLGLTAADDWTVELESRGHPDLQNLYEMLGAPGHYEAHFNIHFRHNYNHVSRTQMYQFVNRHFQLGLSTPVLERDFQRLEREDLTVWTDHHPAPAGEQTGDSHERKLCAWWTEDADRQIGERLRSANREDVKAAREILEPAWRILVGRQLPDDSALEFESSSKEKFDTHVEIRGSLWNRAKEEHTQLRFFHPAAWNGGVVLWLTKPGGSPPGPDHPSVSRLLAGGHAIVMPRLFGPKLTSNPRVHNPGSRDSPSSHWKASSVYYYGYNHSLFSRRVHDVLNALAFVRSHEDWDVSAVSLVALRGTGHFGLGALAVAGDAVDRAVVDPDHFRFGELRDVWAADFLPGAAKYGDLLGMAGMFAPRPLWITGTDAELQDQATPLYRALGKPGNLRQGSFDAASLAAFVSADP